MGETEEKQNFRAYRLGKKESAFRIRGVPIPNNGSKIWMHVDVKSESFTENSENWKLVQKRTSVRVAIEYITVPAGQ